MRRCLPNYNPINTAAWTSRKPESDIYRLCHGCDLFEALPPRPAVLVVTANVIAVDMTVEIDGESPV